MLFVEAHEVMCRDWLPVALQAMEVKQRSVDGFSECQHVVGRGWHFEDIAILVLQWTG